MDKLTEITSKEINEYLKGTNLQYNYSSSWIHKKTGNLYVVDGIVLNATNDRDGQLMAMYHSIDNTNMIFVRELKEFLTKFAPNVHG